MADLSGTTIVLLAVLAATVGAAASVLFTARRVGSVPMPSSRSVHRAVVAEVARYPHARVVDLGSGWGGLALAVARACPERTVVGIEASRLPLLVSRLRAAARQRASGTVTFRRGDFRTEAPRGDTIYLCYLAPESMRAVADLLARAPRPGSVLISVHFGLRGHEPVRIIRAADLHRTEILVYEP